VFFRDILKLPAESNGAIEPAALTASLPKIPVPVLEQVFSDHGRKEEFQRQYGDQLLLAVTLCLMPSSCRQVRGDNHEC
jgi:hypothetical protein